MDSKGKAIAKADWASYKQDCLHLISDTLIIDDTEICCSELTDAILTAATRNIPKTSQKIKDNFRPLPFWTKACSDAVKYRNIARNKLNKSRRDEDGMLYRKTKAITQKTIKMAASEHWQGFCNSLDRSTKLGSVWRMSKKMLGIRTRSKMPTIVKNSVPFEKNLEKANVLAEAFAETSSNKNYHSTFIEHKNYFENNNRDEFTDNSTEAERSTVYNESFTLTELKAAIKSCKNKTAPGPDTISYEMIKELPSESVFNFVKNFQ